MFPRAEKASSEEIFTIYLYPICHRLFSLSRLWVVRCIVIQSMVGILAILWEWGDWSIQQYYSMQLIGI